MKRSLGIRIILFFARRPDEELSYEDISIKFNVQKETTRKALDLLLRDKWVVKSYNQTGKRNAVIKAGPTLLNS